MQQGTAPQINTMAIFNDRESNSGKIHSEIHDDLKNFRLAIRLWISREILWIGNCKNENQFDEFGNTLLNASYNWDNPSNQRSRKCLGEHS